MALFHCFQVACQPFTKIITVCVPLSSDGKDTVCRWDAKGLPFVFPSMLELVCNQLGDQLCWTRLAPGAIGLCVRDVTVAQREPISGVCINSHGFSFIVFFYNFYALLRSVSPADRLVKKSIVSSIIIKISILQPHIMCTMLYIR